MTKHSIGNTRTRYPLEDEVIRILDHYDKVLGYHHPICRVEDTRKCVASSSEGLAHCRWLLQRLRDGKTPYEMVDRQIGFIQGVMWLAGLLSIRDMKTDNDILKRGA